MEIPLALDNGFLRRECPTCLREFKWHHGVTAGRPSDAVDPEQYTCPYCGHRATHDSWWTTDQLDVIRQAALVETSRELTETFAGLSRKHGSGGLSFKVTTGSAPLSPIPTSETDDMATIESPCHPYEPIKVLEHWDGPFHCIVCGERFVA